MKKTVLILSFSLFSLYCLAQWTDQSSGLSNDLNEVFFIDDNTGWVAGRQGKIVHTTDGGSTWNAENSGTSEDLNKIHMVNANAGYAVGDNGTVIKYDGSSWSTIDIDYSQDMHGVYFLDASTGWISGDWGRIMKTEDSGDSWDTEMDNSTFTNLFYDLHMISSDEGWAVGTSGKVLKYDGSSWSEQSTPVEDDLFAVHFSSAGNGFMVGDQSKVYHYDGSDWAEHSTSLSSSSYDVEDVHVADDNTAYAVTAITGGGGIIMEYDGSTWSTDYENTDFLKTELFYGVHLTSATNGYTVGAGGMIKAMSADSDNPTGIAGIDIDSSIKIYPNPSNGNFSIDTKNIEGKISIYNVVGEKVFESGMLPDEIDISGHPKGIYSIQINNNGKIYTGHIIVQ